MVPSSIDLRRATDDLAPPSIEPTSSHVIKGVIEAETGAIEHYNPIIEATDGTIR